MSRPPGPFRPTLGTMMLVIVLAGIAFGASAGVPSPVMLAGLILGCLLVMGLLQTAILGIIYRRGAARGFWAGFALFGWPAFAWVLFLLLDHPPFYEPPIFILMIGVIPFAWLGGTIGRGFAVAAEQEPGGNP
jgi:hypothetical protein